MKIAAQMEPALSRADGQAEEVLQTQETINQHVYERARSVLSPDQWWLSAVSRRIRFTCCGSA